MKRTSRVNAFVILFLAGHAVIPPLYVDLYPFSTFPMFSDAGRTCLQTIDVYQNDNVRIGGAPLGLYSNYVANPAPRIGCWFGPSEFDRRGFFSEEQLQKTVIPRMCDMAYPPVRVLQREYCIQNGRAELYRKLDTELAAECG